MPDLLYLQNHGGVYRSEDGGESWQDIAPGLPSEFGFPIVVHPHDPDTVYAFPIVDAGARWPVDGQARVWRSSDRGKSWSSLGEGSLPDEYYVAVMRDAMCVDTHDTASTSAVATAASGHPRTPERRGRRSTRTSPTSASCAPPSSDPFLRPPA
jgi:hypothetical protein